MGTWPDVTRSHSLEQVVNSRLTTRKKALYKVIERLKYTDFS